jgi:cytochrome c1
LDFKIIAMKKYILLSFILVLSFISGMFLLNSCTVSQKVNDKTGTQLWGENCGRCHNAPGPGELNAVNWDIVGKHMKVRANITDAEEKKIIEYLKSTGN